MDQNDFEIGVLQECVSQTDDVQLPRNCHAFGVLSSGDVKVFVKQDVYQQLEELAASDMSRELGSILLGTYVQEYGEYHVVISAYIEAKYAKSSASTLTFTHETWEYVHNEREKHHPELKIIGWQHTHPGYGIFLSAYDLFIHENFFDMPFQIAYVIDPVSKRRGFFQWKQGKVEKLNGYFVYDEVGKTIIKE